jgi:predicted membrane protein
MGLSSALGEKSLASVLGSVVFALVLLPTLAAATQALGLEAISQPVGNLLETVIGLIPKLISAALVVAIGAVLGRILAGLVTALLAGLGINRVPTQLGLGENFQLGGRNLSELAGGAVMAAALLLALTQAFEILGFAVLTNAMAALGEVLVRLAVAVVVFGVGFWLAAIAAQMVEGSTLLRARELGQVVRGAILFFAAALALRQTGLPGDIITIAFASVVGGLGLGAAIALGLGGRKVAGNLLEGLVAALQRGKKQVSTDSTRDPS